MKSLTGSLPKGLILLEYFAKNQAEVPFNTLKKYSGLSSNVLSRLLKTLVEWGYIEKSPKNGRYRIGRSFLTLCQQLDANKDRSLLSRPVLEVLSDDTEESSAYFDFDGEWVTLLAKNEVPDSYHYFHEGSREIHSPLNSFFYCMLAFLDKDTAMEVINKRSDHYGFTEHQLEEDFYNIRKERVWVHQLFYKRSQITRVCSPVLMDDGSIVGSVGITFNSHIIEADDLQTIKNSVKEAADKLTEIF